MADDRAIRALTAAGLKIARGTASGRLAFAQAHSLITPEIVPAPIRQAVMKELDDAASQVRPLDANQVSRILQRAWNAEPDKVLEGLDLASPLAVTAGAQVHTGRYDGRPVAVKVLRPGLAELVRSDLTLLDTLVVPASAVFPAADIGAVLREVRERVLDELDLEHSATAQRAAARALRRDSALHVPAVVSDLTVDDVLVSELADGPTLAAGVPRGEDAAKIARLLVRFFLGSARAIGLAHGDAEPANVILSGDGITIVDFGATAAVSAELLAAALDGLVALRDNDDDAFADVAVERLGVLPDRETAASALRLLTEIGGELLDGPARLDAAALLDVAGRADAHLPNLISLASRVRVVPEHLWPLRMLASLAPTLARLGVTEDWVALALAAGHKGW